MKSLTSLALKQVTIGASNPTRYTFTAAIMESPMSDLNDASPPPEAQTAAGRDRVRRFRARKKAGIVRTVADLHRPIIGDLVTLGWLAADKRQDRAAVGAAFRAFARHAWRMSRRTPGLFKASGGLT
jgi:hypothetical protein